jgi:hypothetical protein
MGHPIILGDLLGRPIILGDLLGHPIILGDRMGALQAEGLDQEVK